MAEGIYWHNYKEREEWDNEGKERYQEVEEKEEVEKESKYKGKY